MVIIPFIFIFFIVVAYSGAINAPFILDDLTHIVANPALRLPGSFFDNTRLILGFARPLTDFTLMLNYQMTGLDVTTFHMTNIFFHILTSCALYFTLRSIVKNERTSMLVTLVWALHPIHTQAVTYTIQRAEILFSFFIVSTLYFYINRDAKKYFPYLAFCCAVLGMLSKPIMVIAPFLCLLYTLILEERKKLLNKTILLIFSSWLILGALLLNATKLDKAAGLHVANLSWFGYVLTMPEIILHYIHLIFIPIPLIFDYNWPVEISTLKASLFSLALISLIAGVSFLCVKFKQKTLLFFFLWYFILLIPTSGLVVIKDLAFEYRNYLPSFGLIAGASLLLSHLPAKVFTSILVLWCCFLMFATRARNEDYQNPQQLWISVLDRLPNNARALNELATLKMIKGENDEALALFAKALTQDKNNPGPAANIAHIYLMQQKPQEAEAILRSEIARKNDFPLLSISLANLYREQNRLDEASALMVQAMKYNPDDIPLKNTMALIEMSKLNFDGAITIFEKTLKESPYDTVALNALGICWQNKGRGLEAEKYFALVQTLK